MPSRFKLQWVCRGRGCTITDPVTIPHLPDAHINVLRDNVVRSHERKSPACHSKRGVSDVWIHLATGVKVRFADFTILPTEDTPLENLDDRGGDPTLPQQPDPSPADGAAPSASSSLGALNAAREAGDTIGHQWAEAKAPAPEPAAQAEPDDPRELEVYTAANNLRRRLKAIGADAKELRTKALTAKMALVSDRAEAIANATIGYRHIEDASMRIGKMLQAIDGGISVYDRDTTVGA
jgi:hypothetical protein